MRNRLLPILVVVPVLLAGCSWGIRLNAGGRQVRTAWLSDVSGCKYMGKITVSVMDRLGPVNRNQIKVDDELEVMARNQAATMQADTVKPLGKPQAGEQSWGAYQCGAKVLPAEAAKGTTQPPTGKAKTYPIGSDGGG